MKLSSVFAAATMAGLYYVGYKLGADFLHLVTMAAASTMALALPYVEDKEINDLSGTPYKLKPKPDATISDEKINDIVASLSRKMALKRSPIIVEGYEKLHEPTNPDLKKISLNTYAYRAHCASHLSEDEIEFLLARELLKAKDQDKFTIKFLDDVKNSLLYGSVASCLYGAAGGHLNDREMLVSGFTGALTLTTAFFFTKAGQCHVEIKSRQADKAYDNRAVTITGKPQEAISCLKKLNDPQYSGNKVISLDIQDRIENLKTRFASRDFSIPSHHA